MKQLGKVTRQIMLYLVLAFGYLYLYVVDIDLILHPEKEGVVKSKTHFVYQQF